MNDEANPTAPHDGQPAAPRWEAPPARPQSGPPATAQPPFWTAPQQQQQPRSGPPAPPWESQQRSGPPASPAPPWESRQRSGPPDATTSAVPATPVGTTPVDTPAVSAPQPPQFNSSRPAGRGRRTGWIAGVVAALLAGGLGGYFIGAAGEEGSTAAPAPAAVTPDPAGAAALPPFEARHVAANKAKLDGDLAPLAEPWLAELDNCVSNLDRGAPPLGGDESRHVTCRLGPAWVHFITYKAEAQKNAARTYRQQLNFNSDALAAGVRDPARTTGGVTKAPGKLIEYAFPHQDKRVWCGLFWERDDVALGTVMVETFCAADLGNDWDVLRDLWQRHS